MAVLLAVGDGQTPVMGTVAAAGVVFLVANARGAARQRPAPFIKGASPRAETVLDASPVGAGAVRRAVHAPDRLTASTIRTTQDPETGVHVARVDEIPALVVSDAPDLGRVGEHPALRGLDRVVDRRWDEVRDLTQSARVAGVDHANPVRVP